MSDLLRTLATANAGESLVYWVGHLAEDCEKKNTAAIEARSAARLAREKGLAHLVQKRVGDRFEYRAIRRTRRGV